MDHIVATSPILVPALVRVWIYAYEYGTVLVWIIIVDDSVDVMNLQTAWMYSVVVPPSATRTDWLTLSPQRIDNELQGRVMRRLER